MKLASLKEGGRDGALIVVNRELRRGVRAGAVAPTLQKAMDDWATVSPRLAELAESLRDDKAPGSFELDTSALAAPLPRAFQWADGSAYVVHVELVRKARGVEMPPSFWTDPLMYQGGSDSFVGCNDEIEMADEAWGIDFEGEIGVIVDDVPMGISPVAARKHIKLVTILNDVSLRNVIVAELAKGFGFFHGKPATAFAPVALFGEVANVLAVDPKLPIRTAKEYVEYCRKQGDNKVSVGSPAVTLRVLVLKSAVFSLRTTVCPAMPSAFARRETFSARRQSMASRSS